MGYDSRRVTETALDITKPEAQLTRTGLELKQLSELWSRKPRGDKFTHALLTFLGSKRNRGTRRLYAFGINEFFSWYRVQRGYLPLPSEVLRADAYAFVEYLYTRNVGLDEQRLQLDPNRQLDLSVYRLLKTSPGVRITAIRQHLLRDSRFVVDVSFTTRGIPQRARVLEIEASEPRGDDLDAYMAQHSRPPNNGLDIYLACLCQHRLLRRTPTLQEIRRGLVDVGEDRPAQAQIGYRVDPDVFQYYINTYTEAQGVERAGTVVSRLSALSSFWTFLVRQSAENVPGFDRLLEHNIWIEPTQQARKKAINRAKIRREQSVPNRELFLRVLTTTFSTSHGENAAAAAAAALEGANVDSMATSSTPIFDVRDRALLLFVYWTGVRADELSSVRRSELDHDTGLITIIGKGDETRIFTVPQPALAAIRSLQKRLDEIADKSPATALVHLVVLPSSPLIPPLRRWGRASTEAQTAEELSGITTSTFAHILHQRAELAAIGKDTDDWYRIHPHGLRHLAALEANRRGVDVATIQATLGHGSLATTGIYLEVRDPRERSLMPKRPAAAPMPPAVTFDAQVERPRPVEAPPEAPPEFERITETISERIALTDEAKTLAKESDAVAYLLDVYKSNWGEAGDKARGVKSERTHMLAQAKGVGGILSHAYVGKSSGLCWWAGATGGMADTSYSYVPNMRFASMPVMSPAQFLGAPGSEVCSQRICQALSELYEKWLADESRGPTAASALVRWIYVASRVTAETDEAIRARHGTWVTFEDSLDATKAKGLPQTLREHLDDAIVAWFETTAWQYRPTESSMLTPEGDEWEPPSWYAEEDPLQSLPEADRLELLDWLNVMVGRPPVDATPRYAGKSRSDIGKVLASLCSYEQLATDKELRQDVGPATFRQYLAAADADIRKQVAKLTDGRMKDYAYGESKTARRLEKTRSEVETSIAKRKAEAEGKPPEQLEEELKDIRASYDKRLAPHFMEVLASLVSDEAVKDDAVLNLYGLCTAGVPLARGESSQLSRYKSLFRQAGGTIKHEPEFKREFAKETGQHSECVARRLARHIWEDGRLGAWYKRGNWTDPYLFAKTAYRVPCNAAQEQELRAMVGAGALPVRDEWQKSERSIQASLEGERPMSEIEEARLEEEHRGLGQEDVARIEHRLARAAEKRARENISLSKREQALRRFVPNPIDFLPVLYGISQ